MKFNRFFLILGALVFSACSSGGGSGGGGQGATGLAKLSPEQQAAYQAWLKAPIKSCEARDVVGGGSNIEMDFPGPGDFPGMPSMPAPSKSQESEKGLDVVVLAQRTGGSLWLSETPNSEAFAVLSGAATGFTNGVSNSKFEETITVNDVEQKVKVETTSSGFDCTVKINDVEVAKLLLAKSVDVAAAVSRTAKFQDVSGALAGTIGKTGGVTIFNVSALRNAVESTLGDQTGAINQLKRIGYSEEEARKYFVLQKGVYSPAGAFGVQFGTSRTSFAAQNEILFQTDLASHLPAPGQTRVMTTTLVYRVSGGSIAGVQFGAGPTQVMTVRRQVELESKASQITIRDLNSQTVTPSQPTPADVDQCVADRVPPYAELYKTRLGLRQRVAIPARGLLFDVCSVFDPNIENRLKVTGGDRMALNTLLDGVSREQYKASGEQFQFGGWYTFVSESVLAALDPSSSATLANGPGASILVETDQFVAAAKQVPNFTQLSKPLKEVAAQFIVRRSERSRGMSQESTLVRRAVAAGVVVGDSFVDPYFNLLNSDFQDVPSIESGLDWIERSVTPALLQAGREAFAEAVALNYSDYLTETHGRFFLVRPTESSLIEIRDRMRAVRSQLASYPQLGSVKGKLTSVILKSNLSSADVPMVIAATASMASANETIAESYLEILQKGVTSADAANARAWGLALTAADQKAVQDYLQGATAIGAESDARTVIREMPKTRPASAELQARVVAYQLAGQFLQAETARAQGSSRDVFYESDAKEMSRRIGREMFNASDVAALEVFAQVAASEVYCGSDARTISVRLKCANLDRFSKQSRKLLSPEYQGRYITFATKVSSWMQQLMPQTDHSTVRRNLKNALYGNSDAGPWGTCQANQFDVNNRALDQAMQVYIQSIGDFAARFKAERAVSAALDVRCP